MVEITPTHIEEVFSIRRVLEGFAVRRTIDHAGLEELRALRKTVTQMQQAAAASDLAHSSELDLQFHRLICLGAHHNVLLQMWKSIEAALRLYLAYRHRVVYEDSHHIIDTHPDILAAIEAKDAERAAQLLDSHIQEAEAAIYNSNWFQKMEAN